MAKLEIEFEIENLSNVKQKLLSFKKHLFNENQIFFYLTSFSVIFFISLVINTFLKTLISKRKCMHWRLLPQPGKRTIRFDRITMRMN